ncbi:GGDEF domain-containing protein [Candidatus Sumerlaeota bacterium]|nr:GGDEF domain-containing protein [Candidatus Sumerlaeota bacterium]
MRLLNCFRSIESRLRIAPFITMALALVLSMGAVHFFEHFGLLHSDESLTNLALTLFLTVFLGILINLIFIPFVMRPIRNFEQKLVTMHDRHEVRALDIEAHPDFKASIKTMHDLLAWAEKQTSMASMINQAIRQKAQRAERDAMTGLYNKAFLFNYLPDELQRSQTLHDKLSLLMIDIDHFKHYNDTNGHRAGDRVLIEVADLLMRSVRDLDVCIRYGGEEFILILPKSSSERAKNLAERLRKKIFEYNFEYGDRQPGGRVTASFGVATFPDQTKSVESLIEIADQALYQSKKTGRNKVTVFGEDTARMHTLDEDLDIEVINRSDLG